MDQSRFITVETADEVFQQLRLNDERRAIEGNTFEIHLCVKVPFGAEVDLKSMTLIVERNRNGVAHTHRNNDDIFEAEVRIEQGGTPFWIDITIPVGLSDVQGAYVTASPEMEQVIMDYIARQDAA